MLRTFPGITKNADPRAHLKDSPWEARAGAEPCSVNMLFVTLGSEIWIRMWSREMLPVETSGQTGSHAEIETLARLALRKAPTL